jgi:hypothetical protein
MNGQESGVRSQKSEVRSQESGVRSQESGVRSQESEVRSQESEVAHRTRMGERAFVGGMIARRPSRAALRRCLGEMTMRLCRTRMGEKSLCRRDDCQTPQRGFSTAMFG